MMQPRNYAEFFLLTSKFFDISFTEKKKNIWIYRDRIWCSLRPCLHWAYNCKRTSVS